MRPAKRRIYWPQIVTAVVVVAISCWAVLGGAGDRAAEPRSPKWPKVREAHLKAYSSCAACGTKDNLQVHHVKPFHLFPSLELDPGNLITLCQKPGHNCHFVFGHNYNWKAWNPRVRQDAHTQLWRVKNRAEE